NPQTIDVGNSRRSLEVGCRQSGRAKSRWQCVSVYSTQIIGSRRGSCPGRAAIGRNLYCWRDEVAGIERSATPGSGIIGSEPAAVEESCQAESKAGDLLGTQSCPHDSD